MINIFKFTFILLATVNLGFNTFPAYANNTDPCSLEQEEITFNTHPIFDESEKGILFFHRWANTLHIKTKLKTLQNEAAFFINKCNKTAEDLAELERHLRHKKYLVDAKVLADSTMKKITIDTWDNWSLMPTISFGRKGGENSSSFGIKERNLLGLGIDTEIEYYNNNQRTGYKISTTLPLFQQHNSEVSLRFADNNDGTQHSIFFTQSFASFYTPYAYHIGFNEETREDTLYQNNNKQSSFEHNINFQTLSYAWLTLNDDNHVLRFRLGMTKDQHTFTHTPTFVDNIQPEIIPLNRSHIYPWASLAYIEKDFKELTNIHLISQIEDFNIGWQINARFGINIDNKNKVHSKTLLLWQTDIKKGFSFTNGSLLLFNLSLAGETFEHGHNRIVANIGTEYFYHFSEDWSVYVNNENTFTENQYIDTPVTMGGDTGIRGFPLQYQHGQSNVKFTTEIRYYPRINLFKLFDLAGAAFIDSGKAMGSSIIKNNDTGWLYSVGAGIRLYSPHSGGNNPIIHIDFATPITDDADVNGFEVRIQTKKTF